LKKLDREKLHEIFVKDVKTTLPEFSCKKGNPFRTNLHVSQGVNIYLKNISPAYFKNKDVTRIQILNSSKFKTIKEGNGTCIPVGYDSKNETYVVWDPKVFLDRINSAANISIYSRLSHQKLSRNKYFYTFTLQNNEMVYCVSKIKIGDFLKNITKFFKLNNHNSISKTDPFKFKQEYRKQDIYEILRVPTKQQGGKWNNGYCKHEDDHYIFANIRVHGKGYSGETFDYNNKINSEKNLEWEAKNGSKLHHPSIQEILSSTPYVFTRDEFSTKNHWEFLGIGTIKDCKEGPPVKAIWSFYLPENNSEIYNIEHELEDFINRDDFLGAVMHCVNEKKEEYPNKSIKDWREEIKNYFVLDEDV